MSTTSPRDSIELLEVFRIGLATRLIDKSEIIQWADEIILKDTHPDYLVIDLSLSGRQSINDIISSLNEYIGENKPQISGRVILGLLYNRYIDGKIDLGQTVKAIYWMVWELELSAHEKSFMYGLEEDYILATDYGNSRENIERETLRFIQIYKSFRIDNSNNWADINKTIDSQIVQLLAEIKEEQHALTRTKSKNKWWKLLFK